MLLKDEEIRVCNSYMKNCVNRWSLAFLVLNRALFRKLVNKLMWCIIYGKLPGEVEYEMY